MKIKRWCVAVLSLLLSPWAALGAVSRLEITERIPFAKIRSLLSARAEAAPGAAYFSPQDCRDHFARLEEGSVFRR